MVDSTAEAPELSLQDLQVPGHARASPPGCWNGDGHSLLPIIGHCFQNYGELPTRIQLPRACEVCLLPESHGPLFLEEMFQLKELITIQQ